uniref:Uncharacterized protein n=1 Tax=Romanomermis culicivorax TaxID=13658 RepID=A0A915JMR2_ROMCU
NILFESDPQFLKQHLLLVSHKSLAKVQLSNGTMIVSDLTCIFSSSLSRNSNTGPCSIGYFCDLNNTPPHIACSHLETLCCKAAPSVLASASHYHLRFLTVYDCTPMPFLATKFGLK